MNSEPTEKQGIQAFVLTFASGICFVLAFYPFGFAWMGWLAPLGVLTLVVQKELPGRRPYLQIWLACFVCWLALFQCVRLPHWAGYIGWPFLAGFLGSYLFLFVPVTRHLVHRWKIPVLIAAPVSWVGLEYIQAHFCTGISLGMLSHTQSVYPQLIQVADIGGCYTVTFFIVGITAGLVFAASGFFSFFGYPLIRFSRQVTRLALGLGQVLVLLVFLIGYGNYRIQESDGLSVKHPHRIALLQGSIDTRFPSESEIGEYLDSFTEQYTRLSRQACEQSVDLVMMPESMFPVTDVYPATDHLSPEEQRKVSDYQRAIYATAHIVTNAGEIKRTESGSQFEITGRPVPIIAGASSAPVGKGLAFYNSAIHISNEGKVVNRYGKMKLVLFGEFVPLGDIFPWLYSFFPIPPGLKAGESPVALEQDGIIYSPSICFESTYPHLIRQQVLYLKKQGQKPDSLVNLTNDGWFYGSTALDMHFANNVFRAIENRTPLLIAANTGFSGQIDSAGRVLAKGPRRKEKVLIVNLISSNQASIYHLVGDWPAFSCFIPVLACFFAWICAPFLRKKLQLNDRSQTDVDKKANG